MPDWHQGAPFRAKLPEVAYTTPLRVPGIIPGDIAPLGSPFYLFLLSGGRFPGGAEWVLFFLFFCLKRGQINLETSDKEQYIFTVLPPKQLGIPLEAGMAITQFSDDACFQWRRVMPLQMQGQGRTQRFFI